MDKLIKNDDQEIRINGKSIKKPRKKPRKKRLHIFRSLILVLLLLVILMGLYVFGIKGVPDGNLAADVVEDVQEAAEGKEGKVTTITESSLEEVFELNELQTAEYIYNAVVPVEGEKGIEYHVAYEGTVTAGVNFDELKITVDEDQKKICITVPKVTILDTIVEADSLEYIFEKKKYDNEQVYKEAYSLCQKDLEERAKNDEKLLELASENVHQVIKAMVSPWVEQVDSKYEIIIQ